MIAQDEHRQIVVGVVVREPTDRAVRPLVDLEETGLLAGEDQAAIAVPARVMHRDAIQAGLRLSRDESNVVEAPDRAGAQLRDFQHRGVPGHRRVVPLQPGQSPVGRERRIGVEVGTAGEDVLGSGRTIGVRPTERHERGLRLARVSVILTNRQHGRNPGADH